MASIDISLLEIPADWAPYVVRFRKYLGDTPELNELTEAQESTDFELFIALQDAYDEMNYSIEPIDLNYISHTEVPWSVLQLGGLLNILTMKGVLSSRNTLTYNDSGGITVKDMDKYGRYINYFNIMGSDFKRRSMAIKRAKNINSAYGGVESEYSSITQ